MKTCPKCLAENVDTAAYCTGCAEPLQSGVRTCPNGHPMDPSWTDCQYCRSQSGLSADRPIPPARAATVFEGSSGGGRGSGRTPTYREDNPLPPRLVNGPAAPAGAAAGQPARRRESTVYRPVSGQGSDPGQATPVLAKDRKIVGILVTYSWSPEGQVFPIREGRNFIGRDKECEVCIPDDQTMSGKNSHITFRQNFVVGDMVSMTGTDLDGVAIEQQFHSLGNYATIRAGSTYFTFIVISPPQGNLPESKEA